MSRPTGTADIRRLILRLLGDIAPEADLSTLRPDVSFRDQLDLDSMDFLNFVVALHKEFQIDIPEADYPKYQTLNGCLAQLGATKA
ncbi:MAG: Acyl carrier protein [Nitrospirae bacterium]|nr:MAG: putative acyl carrier protein [Nitrospira sp. OLB3]MBV6471302.1 Acyl carrier protein [Nitrospirota bacterium]MCE7966599.1 acyl carrier protein [Nitrospira sp. NTP2]MCK6492026.1 acyl carrier protein [Nitrospira sp.]MEB2338841.1 acyl carrier protein [Nitrospirales bacterium]